MDFLSKFQSDLMDVLHIGVAKGLVSIAKGLVMEDLRGPLDKAGGLYELTLAGYAPQTFPSKGEVLQRVGQAIEEWAQGKGEYTADQILALLCDGFGVEMRREV